MSNGKRRLEVTILRKNRREDRFKVEADPRDPATLKDILTGWLEAEGWAKGRWNEFEMTARETSGPKVNVTVRP